jgi:protein involved in polysaccharide export with SLBB domain
MIVAAILAVAGVGMAQEPAKEAPKPYELRVGDAIQISVAADRRLDSVQVVRPDGKIAIKLVGEMQAEGQTLERFRAVLAEKIEGIVPSPNISVKVLQVAPLKPWPADVDPKTYVLKPHDLVQIADSAEPRLNGVYRIRPDGKISVVLCGEVQVEGLTPDGFASALTQKLGEILRSPGVTVRVVLSGQTK